MSSALPDAEMILTTTATVDEAERLAEALVARQLAACVQIDGPVRSFYRWQGNLDRAEEWRLMIKTTAARAEETCRWLADAHPYEEPEVLRLPIRGGSPGYLAWVAAQVEP